MRTLSLLVLATVLLTGCSSRGTASSAPPTATHVPPSTPVTFTSDTSSIHLAYLRARSYTPDRHLSIHLAGGHTLFAVHSVCTGSADGHCQAIDAFLDGRRAPILDRQYSAVQAMRSIQNGFLVVAQSYRTGDPLCCPSGPTVQNRYIWNGATLIERGPLPHEPSG